MGDLQEVASSILVSSATEITPFQEMGLLCREGAGPAALTERRLLATLYLENPVEIISNSRDDEDPPY